MSKELPLRYGKDDKLEAEADALLRGDKGKNRRGKRRDREKMLYEAGLISAYDLERYNPANDWDTQDEPEVLLVGPSDIANYSPTICADVDDGNVRARNPSLAKRRALMRHVDDEDGWGSAMEVEPLPPMDIGERKVCTKCGRSKGLGCFYSNPRAKDGLHSWCKPCLKSNNKTAGGDK